MGVARQYCGRLGKVANCQGGMFLAYVSPLGRALVDKGLYLPESWTSDPGRCAAAGVPEERRYRSKTDGLGAAGAGPGVGPPQGGWVPETTPSGRPFGSPWRAWGCATCWTFRAALRSGPWSLRGTRPGPLRGLRGSGAPASPGSGTGSVVPWSSAVTGRMRTGGR